MRSLRRALLPAVTLCLLSAGVVLAAPTADTFSGTLKGTTGSAKGARAGARAVIVPGPYHGNSPTRTLRLTFSRIRCPHSGRCLRVIGTLRGTITRQRPPVPDVGTTYVVRASGTLRGAGRTQVRGTVQSPGYVFHGNVSMQLTLDSARGRITYTGGSGEVPGFTQP